MTAKQIIDKYISFFEKREHKRIANAALVPENDPTTLFTSSGMQPLITYLLGEKHPMGTRLVNVQNSFRAQDIDEIGDNRHTTFFRMLGNWSLGDYFKKEQIPWFFEFLTNKEKGLGLDPEKLYVTAFKGNKQIRQDTESIEIWKSLFKEKGIDAKINERIFLYDEEKNWWSRSGTPDKMPVGEIGGTDSEVFYDFGTTHATEYGSKCHPNCECGRFMEIGNSVFMEYKKTEKGFEKLPKRNVDFGGGLERLLAAAENKQDVFQTSLLKPIIDSIEKITQKTYKDHQKQMRIITDHLISSVFIITNNIKPSNKEQGYVLRRLIRRALDNYYLLPAPRHSGERRPAELDEATPESLRASHVKEDSGQARMTIEDKIIPILKSIIKQYQQTDPKLETNYEKIKNTILEEKDLYGTTLKKAKDYIFKKYHTVYDELMGVTEISPDDAFVLYTTHGLSPTQIKSLGYVFDDQKFAEKMKEHQNLSKKGSIKKFSGGLADHSKKTIMGHTATHLLHQALRDVFGTKLHQSGSNITEKRVRFDFNLEKALAEEEIKQVEKIVNEKIKENLPVHFEMLDIQKAKDIGAIGLFDEKYDKTVKVYFIGPNEAQSSYSIEFCGGPHVDFTSEIKNLKIFKQESIGKGYRRIYAKVG
jgi:alanyl-tRNA synthetase